MKLIGTFIIGLIVGVLIGYSFIQSFHLYTPTLIHDTINKRVDSIITIENTHIKRIKEIKIVYDTKKDSIIHLPDSAQFNLFIANCDRYDYMLSQDSAIADY